MLSLLAIHFSCMGLALFLRNWIQTLKMKYNLNLIRLTLNLQESVDQIKQDNPVAFHSAIYYIKNREEVIKKVIKYNNSKKNKN